MAIRPWDATFNGEPVGGDQLSTGDDDILDHRNTVRAELKVEHDCGTATVDGNYLDTGRHKTGSARAFFRATAPTQLLAHSNIGAWPPVIAETDKLGFSTLDNGRLWIDFDDCQLYFREQETTGGVFSDLNVNHAGNATAWISLWPRTVGYMGTATDNNQTTVVDTRTPITGATVTVITPDDGRVYQIVSTATVHYAVPSGEEVAFWLEDDQDGDLDYALVQHAGGGSGSLGSATLQHIKTPAVAGTTYVYTVDFACSAVTAHVNPDVTSAVYTGNGGSVRVDFARHPTWCRITAELRPNYGIADY